jgi:zinc transporter ZupT
MASTLGVSTMITVTMISLFAGLGNLLGGWCLQALALSQTRMSQLMALGAGFLMGGALFTMLPIALHATGNDPTYIAVGYFGLLLLRWLLHPKQNENAEPTAESAWAALIGMVLHSLLDGAALGVAARLNTQLGIVAVVAIFLHKIPEGFSLSALVLAASRSRTQAHLANLVAALATLAGVAIATASADILTLPQGALLGMAAGSFLYVGSTDMMPSVIRKQEGVWLAVIGALLVYLLAGGHTHPH